MKKLVLFIVVTSLLMVSVTFASPGSFNWTWLLSGGKGGASLIYTPGDALLLETDDYLLLETDDKLLLEG